MPHKIVKGVHIFFSCVVLALCDVIHNETEYQLIGKYCRGFILPEYIYGEMTRLRQIE